MRFPPFPRGQNPNQGTFQSAPSLALHTPALIPRSPVQRPELILWGYRARLFGKEMECSRRPTRSINPTASRFCSPYPNDHMHLCIEPRGVAAASGHVPAHFCFAKRLCVDGNGAEGRIYSLCSNISIAPSGAYPSPLPTQFSTQHVLTPATTPAAAIPIPSYQSLW